MRKSKAVINVKNKFPLNTGDLRSITVDLKGVPRANNGSELMIQSTFVLFPKSERLPVENVQMSVKAKTMKVRNMKKKKTAVKFRRSRKRKPRKLSIILTLKLNVPVNTYATVFA